MKLDKKIKDRIDNYFDKVTSKDFAKLLKEKYDFDIVGSDEVLEVKDTFEVITSHDIYITKSSVKITANKKTSETCKVALAA